MTLLRGGQQQETETKAAAEPAAPAAGFLTPAAVNRVQRIGTLQFAQGSGGVAFVDNSGSTSGLILRVLQRFTTQLAPQSTALWPVWVWELASNSAKLLSPVDAPRLAARSHEATEFRRSRYDPQFRHGSAR